VIPPRSPCPPGSKVRRGKALWGESGGGVRVARGRTLARDATRLRASALSEVSWSTRGERFGLAASTVLARQRDLGLGEPPTVQAERDNQRRLRQDYRQRGEDLPAVAIPGRDSINGPAVADSTARTISPYSPTRRLFIIGSPR
jgi:hypothetical protein